MIDIGKWMQNFSEEIQAAFNERLRFIGLQGSFGRGEATEKSDIDVVVILDNVELADLQLYDCVISKMEFRDKICGFISGIEELTHWDGADLFQFYYDTQPVYGDITDLRKQIKVSDIYRAVHQGACNIYHGCVHNIVHDKNEDILKSLYKSAVFVLQAKAFDEFHTYMKTKQELLEYLTGMDKAVLEKSIEIKKETYISRESFDAYSDLIFTWSKALVVKGRKSGTIL